MQFVHFALNVLQCAGLEQTMFTDLMEFLITLQRLKNVSRHVLK